MVSMHSCRSDSFPAVAEKDTFQKSELPLCRKNDLLGKHFAGKRPEHWYQRRHNMHIRLAFESDLHSIKEIVHTNIRKIYPHYYPSGAVVFFLDHHNDENIRIDILNGCVYLQLNKEQQIVGTVTVRKNEICRLFVLPQYQGKGYGRSLLAFAENEIAKSYGEIVLDASFPAKSIYLKRGYRECGYRIIQANNDYLCYDVMTKQVCRSAENGNTEHL